MKLATLKDGTPDGRLIVVSTNGRRAVEATGFAPNLITALQQWDRVCPALRVLSSQLDAGVIAHSFEFDPRVANAPLPRSPQWIDASAFLNHGRLMEIAFKSHPIANIDTIPVMYQGASDDFLGPCDDVLLPSEDDGIDFEGEFGVITGPVPMGASPEEGFAAIRLIVLINDWSLRALGLRELKSGFGFLQAKPSTSFAPIAVTPDELGSSWRDGRVQMRLSVNRNNERMGEPHGSEMNFSFGQLVAHAARSRRLTTGCIIGSGTVSNISRQAGSACIAERRVIEKIDEGESRTEFMRFGDHVTMQALYDDGREGPFGIIEQRVVAYRR